MQTVRGLYLYLIRMKHLDLNCNLTPLKMLNYLEEHYIIVNIITTVSLYKNTIEILAVSIDTVKLKLSKTNNTFKLYTSIINTYKNSKVGSEKSKIKNAEIVLNTLITQEIIKQFYNHVTITLK